MQRLAWAIVVSAALLSMAWVASSFRLVITQAGFSATVGYLPFWTWLIALAVLVMAMVRMLTGEGGGRAGRGFEVVREEESIR